MPQPSDDLLRQLAASGEVKPWAITALRWLLLLAGVCLVGCLASLVLFSLQALTDNAGGMALTTVAAGLAALIVPAALLLVMAKMALMIGRTS
jgi:hypothetical protein